MFPAPPAGPDPTEPTSDRPAASEPHPPRSRDATPWLDLLAVWLRRTTLAVASRLGGISTRHYGGGWYGLGATLTWLVLVVEDFWEDWTAADSLGDFVTGELFSFGLDAVMNMVWAGVWPLVWLLRLL